MSENQPAPAGDDDVRFDPIEVLRSVVKHIGVAGHGTRRAVFGQISGHGSTVTREIIVWLGLDPDEVVGGCESCGGSGEVECADCDGDGNDGSGCVECDDRGVVTCADCQGSGSEAVRRVLA